MLIGIVTIVLASLVVVAILLQMLYARQIHIWMPAYVADALRGIPAVKSGPTHVVVCMVDHFEPAWNSPGYEIECERITQWVERYPRLASRHSDSDGVSPQYTFFYPAEQYRPEHLDRLAALSRQGYADVEIHLHHDGDTEATLRKQLVEFRDLLHEKHGLLHRNRQTGISEYGFIHGDWALANSARGGRFCGVDNELVVLRETGCYADFTFPSAPSETQTRKINSIYYPAGNPSTRKAHDTGRDVVAGTPGDGLLIIQGPLCLDWRHRKWGVLPRIESGELSADNPPTRDRVDMWVRQHIHVKGRPEWVFVKLFAHGANDRNMATLLGTPLDDMLTYLETAYNDGNRYCLHYMTARQVYNVIKAAEGGATGNPGDYRRPKMEPATPGARSAEGC